MDPLTIMAGATAIGGGMGLVGSVLTNRANQAMAEQQMDFQERMSNTAYQRAMADMKAAGINPMLVTKLGGASTPPGASATLENPGKHLEDTAGKMGQLMATKATLEMERDKTTAQVTRDIANAGMAEAQKAAIETDTWIKKQRFEREFEGLGYDVTIKAGEAGRQGLYDQELAQKVLNAGAQYKAITAGTENTQANTAFTKEKTAITHTAAEFIGRLAPIAAKSGVGVNQVFNWLTTGIGDKAADLAEFKGLDIVKKWQSWWSNLNDDTKQFVQYLFRMAFTTETK